VTFPSRTLLVIAALGATAPAAYALSVKEDDVNLGISLLIQARAEVSESKDTDGNTPYNVHETNNSPDDADFYLRRARFGLKGTYQEDYRFSVIFRGDGAGAAANTNAAAFYEGVIGRVWKKEGSKLVHAVDFGYQAASFNPSGNVYSSSATLVLNEASTAAIFTPRNAGIKYTLNAPWVNFWADVQNGAADSVTAAGTDGEGLWMSGRVHISPEGEWKMDKPAETFAGKAGKGVQLGLEVGSNDSDITAAGAYQSALVYGADLLFHFDGLTALAEYRIAEYDNYDPATLDYAATAWRVQAGYAIPAGSTVVEFAARVSAYDTNDEDSTAVDFGGNAATAAQGKDYGSSGDQIEVGVNWYLKGNNNKLQVAYSDWQAENGNADAQILRAQWQLMF